LRHCALTEFGKRRDYFDFADLKELSQFRLKIASGYNATMDRYGDRILLCTETAFKILNDKSVYQTMIDLQGNRQVDESYKQKCVEEIIGQTIMTKYLKNLNSKLINIPFLK